MPSRRGESLKLVEVSVRNARRELTELEGGVTLQNIGRQSHTSWSESLSSTTQRIGSFEYTQFNDGTGYSTQRIGNFLFTTGTDGSRASTTRIGNLWFTNIDP